LATSSSPAAPALSSTDTSAIIASTNGCWLPLELRSAMPPPTSAIATTIAAAV
jgi:hypothetical protein